MLADPQPQSPREGINENKLKAFSKAAEGINRVVTSSAAGLAAGATLGTIADAAVGATAGVALTGVGTVAGAIIGGIAGALWLAADASHKKDRPEDQEPPRSLDPTDN